MEEKGGRVLMAEPGQVQGPDTAVFADPHTAEAHALVRVCAMTRYGIVERYGAGRKPAPRH